MPSPLFSSFSPVARARPAVALLALCVLACAPTDTRPHYDRSTGTYRRFAAPKAPTPPTASIEPSVGDRRSEALPPSHPSELRRDPPQPSEADPFGASSETGVWGTLKPVAESYLGVGYRFGGSSRAGMDCSGFVRRVFQEALGVELPRTSRAQIGAGSAVSRDELRPGDLGVFRTWLVIDHVGIYYDEGRFIHSSSTLGVTVTSMDDPYFAPRYAGARRLSP